MKYLIGAFFGVLFFLSFASALYSYAPAVNCNAELGAGNVEK